MSKLYLRIYLHFLAIIGVFGIVVAIGWLAKTQDSERRDRFEAMGRLVAQSLPEDGAALTTALEQLADDFHVEIALYRADRVLVASAGTPVPPPPAPGQDTSGWHRADGSPVLLFRLPAGRWLSAHVPWRPRGYWIELLVTLVVIIAVGAYPLARRITHRLERLQARVDALGAGDLGARVDVEGWDEVAALAKSFNRAAARIESLVSAQRTMLASASHELRTPLARMRVAIELLAAAPRPELRERIERDIIELDNLIDELLLASRLQTVHDLEAAEPVDLLALTAEEGTRVGAVVTGDAVSIHGGRRLLRPTSHTQPLRERPPSRRGDGNRRIGGRGRGWRAAPGLRSRPGRTRERAGAHLPAVLPHRGDARERSRGRARPASREGDRRAARGERGISPERAGRIVLRDPVPAGSQNSRTPSLDVVTRCEGSSAIIRARRPRPTGRHRTSN